MLSKAISFPEAIPFFEEFAADRSVAVDSTAARILVADDDPLFRKKIVPALLKLGYNVTEAETGVQLVDHVEGFLRNDDYSKLPDLVVLDYLMPGVTGMEILEGLNMATAYTPFIMVSAFGGKGLRQAAMRRGAVAVFDKPLEVDRMVDQLCETIQALVPVR